MQNAIVLLNISLLFIKSSAGEAMKSSALKIEKMALTAHEEMLRKRWSLEGFTALVTGGSQGIGKAIVEELGGLGAKVYTCARNKEELDRSLQHWRHELKLDVTATVCDISSRLSRENFVEAASSLFQGKLNILIHNAALVKMKKALESSHNDYTETMATNLEAGLHLSQLCHPLLKASGAGSIVFISSIAGSFALPALSIYSASKSAINQLGRNLALEWANDNIRANCVAPGSITTAVTEEYFEERKCAKIEELGIPLRRLGETMEAAALVAFLCMPAAAYITGQVVTVDGGMTATCSSTTAD